MRGELHHIELWVPDLTRAIDSLGWLFTEPYQDWPEGRSWRLGETYIVVEQSPALIGDAHDRRRPGLNHLAFHIGDTTQLDELVVDAAEHGWTLLFSDRHPHAGGPDHHAGYLENSDGFEVELVAHHDEGGAVTGRRRPHARSPDAVVGSPCSVQRLREGGTDGAGDL
jgi:catechol 2,3-dioxygenase-like lactoylglutathione lyase family enzyme